MRGHIVLLVTNGANRVPLPPARTTAVSSILYNCNTECGKALQLPTANNLKKVTVLGGGTGSYVVLRALRHIPHLDLGAIVTMMDSGGSTGRLRDQLGVLPPGDLRQCLVALSEAPDIWRKLFTYRFESGDLRGHNFGNLFISALEKITDSYDQVLDEVHYVMQCVGRVIPATLERANIEVVYDTGRRVESELLLDEHNPDGGVIVDAKAVPSVSANPDAIDRIRESDYIIAGPGDMYSSIVSIALADGIAQACTKTRAKLIYIMNLMTKSAQTKGYGAHDHIRDFTKYFHRTPDVCIMSDTPIPEKMISKYVELAEEPVRDDLQERGFAGLIMKADLMDTSEHDTKGQHLAATYAHSIIRHDELKLIKVLEEVLRH